MLRFLHLADAVFHSLNYECLKDCKEVSSKEFFRTCNVLPFSCTHLALWAM